jgi:hypothetical protein
MCSRIKSQGKQKVLLTRRKKKGQEEVYGGDNSTNLENIDPNKNAIHIHGGMEHNLAEYAKCYSYGTAHKYQEVVNSQEKLITIEEIFWTLISKC